MIDRWQEDAPLCVTPATGTAEREAALLLLTHADGAATVGGDRGFDVASFVAGVRALGITPHVAQKAGQCDRRADHAACGLRDQPTETEADRAGLRLA
jgi:hypothetical protein